MTWLNKQLDWLKSFFGEADGKASNKRLLSTGVVTVFLIAYLKISITSATLNDIPPMWALMIATILGLNIADKLFAMRYGNGKPPQ